MAISTIKRQPIEITRTQHNATDLPSTYNDGISIERTGNTQGFPASYGVLVTFRTNDFFFQLYANYQKHLYFRATTSLDTWDTEFLELSHI